MRYTALDLSEERGWIGIEEEVVYRLLRSGIWAPEPPNDVDDRFVTIS
jgi:hypothetical protein